MGSLLSPSIQARASQLLGWAPQSWRAVAGGYTPAARFVAAVGGRSAFVKVATTPLTAAMLRREARVYACVEGPFMPALLGWEDDERAPMLVIEDLSRARWPPPWDALLIDGVLASLEEMHARTPELPSFHDVHSGELRGWADIAADPAPFLALGVVSAAWLERALPALIGAEAQCVAEGPTLAHFDLRSDNICLAADGPRLVDWSAACLGDPTLDLGFWLPSLAFEGGPAPETFLNDAPSVAACVAGFFATRAGQPGIPDAPFVRRVQREQLTTALPWACRAVGLAPPDL